jgi:hypothetical protein
MAIPKFSEQELEIVSVIPASPFAPEINEYAYPVSPCEAVKAAFAGAAIWQITGSERETFTPRIIPDNVSRALVLEARPFDAETEGGGKDLFGIDWEYVPVAQGSMVKPGAPLLGDMNEWYDKVIWPDIESWDWQGSAQENNGSFLKPEKFNSLMFQTGYFERMISLLDFEGALLALVDEDQHQAIRDFLDKLADLYISIFAKAIDVYTNLHGIEIHDDWGSQQNTFFSPEIVAEFIVPAMRKVNDFIHSKGLYVLAHSCGNNIRQVQNYIDAGYDLWNPQTMNDTAAIYEQFGDQILIGVYDPPLPQDASEAQQRAAARAYADAFCKPGKPSFLNMYSMTNLTPAYREELYIRSRINYSS